MRKRTYFWEKGGSSGRREFENWSLSTVLRHLHFAITVLREGGRLGEYDLPIEEQKGYCYKILL